MLSACGKCTTYSHCTCFIEETRATTQAASATAPVAGHQMHHSSQNFAAVENANPNCETANFFTVNHQHITYNYPVYHATTPSTPSAFPKSPTDFPTASMQYTCSHPHSMHHQRMEREAPSIFYSDPQNQQNVGCYNNNYNNATPMATTVPYTAFECPAPTGSVPEPEFINYSQIKPTITDTDSGGEYKFSDSINSVKRQQSTVERHSTYNQSNPNLPYGEQTYDCYYPRESKSEKRESGNSSSTVYDYDYGSFMNSGFYEPSGNYSSIGYFDTGPPNIGAKHQSLGFGSSTQQQLAAESAEFYGAYGNYEHGYRGANSSSSSGVIGAGTVSHTDYSGAANETEPAPTIYRTHHG